MEKEGILIESSFFSCISMPFSQQTQELTEMFLFLEQKKTANFVIDFNVHNKS